VLVEHSTLGEGQAALVEDVVVLVVLAVTPSPVPTPVVLVVVEVAFWNGLEVEAEDEGEEVEVLAEISDELKLPPPMLDVTVVVKV
jgi:hypothetical protein